MSITDKQNFVKNIFQQKTNSQTIQPVENFSLDIANSELPFDKKARDICQIFEQNHGILKFYWRKVCSSANREVLVEDSFGSVKKMLMFGSNNYFGLATHPKIQEAVKRAMEKYGCGTGGAPALNGYTDLHFELEQKLAEMKGHDSAILYSSGYSTNVGFCSAVASKTSIFLYDELIHASVIDGFVLSQNRRVFFKHNDHKHLESLILQYKNQYKDTFVFVEGIYSMDGDMCSKDILDICHKHNAFITVDEAHSTAVLGKHGHGIAEYFNLDYKIPFSMGTFSKAFAINGGFVAADSAYIKFLKACSRSYLFSTSILPTSVAAVLAGIEIIENDDSFRSKLNENISFVINELNRHGIHIKTDSPILPLLIPEEINIQKASKRFHDEGIFLNTVAYPVVPKEQARFRISLMSTHTKGDLEKLINTIVCVWRECRY